MRFLLADGGYVAFRPSGTEPKAKIYFSIAGSSEEKAQAGLEALQKDVLARVDEIMGGFCG